MDVQSGTPTTPLTECVQRCSDAAEQIVSAEQTAGGKERKKEERKKGHHVLHTAGVLIQSDKIAKINVLHISILL